MSKKLLLSAFVAIIIIVVVVSYLVYRTNASSMQAANPVIHFASLEYAPYYGSELQNGGFVSEIVKAALLSAGYEVRVDFLPWERALRNGKEGVYDGVYTMWYTDERAEHFIFSDPLPSNELVFFSLKDSGITYESIEGLRPHSIGIVKDYAYPDEFLNAGLNTQDALFQKQNFQKLINGEIDLTVEDKAVGLHIIRETFPEYLDQIEIIGKPLVSIPQYVVFPKARANSAELVNIFNESLKELIDSGEFNAILKRHGYSDLFSM